ncbi:MAG: hypothetical protein MUP52_10685, partial [Candidatus Aminicenantes bacterium]|nr:hypothetical protein [Candidatus Aminicenantes bacterium]
MIIPKKILVVSFFVIVLGLLGYFFLLKKGPVSSENQAGGTSASSTAAVSGSGTAQNPQEKIEAAPLPVKAVPARRGELIIKLKSPG